MKKKKREKKKEREKKEMESLALHLGAGSCCWCCRAGPWRAVHAACGHVGCAQGARDRVAARHRAPKSR